MKHLPILHLALLALALFALCLHGGIFLLQIWLVADEQILSSHPWLNLFFLGEAFVLSRFADCCTVAMSFAVPDFG